MLLTFISFVASFKTLFTILSSSFLLGFFSILRYKLICNQEQFYCKLYNKDRDNFFKPALNEANYESADGVAQSAEPTEK